MSLDALCREIAASAESRAGALMRAAHEEAERTLEEAREAASRAHKASREEGEQFAQTESAERLNAAKLEAGKTLSEAREEAVRQAVAQVWEKYRHLRTRPGYAKKLRGWADRAVQELGMDGAALRANAGDLPLLAEAGYKVNRQPIECAGGVKAESRDGRISVDYTLEAQFERMREEVAREAHARLFPEHEEEREMEGEARALRKAAGTSSKSRGGAKWKTVRSGRGAVSKTGARSKNQTKNSKRGRR